jgi:hypothetical protein
MITNGLPNIARDIWREPQCTFLWIYLIFNSIWK